MSTSYDRKVIALITVVAVIANCCLCDQRNIADGVEFEDGSIQYQYYMDNSDSSSKNELKNEYWYQFRPESDAVEGPIPDEDILDSGLSLYVNVSKYPGEKCNRVCKKGQNRICYFEFNLEYYQAMGVACGRCNQGVESDCNHPQCIVGDGFEKGVMSINRKSPGPPIHVCKDDLVIVDVHNRADGSSAALHWHGLHMINTPHMDGVPFVTQCPIHYANSFRYKFNATQAGTQFYHSHSGHHKANGQYGAIVIRQPKEEEPLSILYDFDLPEHYVFIADWMHMYAEQHSPGLPSSGILPDAVIINGRGIYTDPITSNRTNVRPTIYYVRPGKRYRFRLINSINHVCPFSIQIENHNFFVVATDSFTVMPLALDTLVSNAGERYDFILNAYENAGDYWMRIRGMGTCTGSSIESYALIRYVDENVNTDTLTNISVPPFPSYDQDFSALAVLNHPNATCWDGASDRCVTELSAYEDDDELRNAKPDHKFFLSFNNYQIPNEEVFNSGEYFHFTNLISNITMVAAINNLSLSLPDTPLLTQPESIDENQFCDALRRPARCANNRFCHCVHRLKVKLNSIVELIIVDENQSINRVNHPFHLHGYRFMVVGMGQDPDGVSMTVGRARELEAKSRLRRDVFNTSPPFKDTVSIPSRGYTILRLRANNPGFWLMHCHYEWHLSIGMGLILQVGETTEMVKAPSDFPKCGNYLPRVKRPAFQLTLNNLRSYLYLIYSKKFY